MSNSNSTYFHFPFPDEWDSTNERANGYYERCQGYVKTQEEFVSLLDIRPHFHVICQFLIAYIFITGILIIIFRNKYIIKRNNPELTLYFSLGCIINIADSYGVDVNYDKYPCFLVFYCTGISYPLMMVSCIGCISRYLKQYYSSANAFVEVFDEKYEVKNQYGNKKLQNVRDYLIDKYPNRFVLFYILIVTIYSLLVSLFGNRYRIFNDVDKGFCIISLEYAPQLILIVTFSVIYIPYTLYELKRIEDTFNIKNVLYVSLITIFLCIIGYFVSSLTTAYNCTPEFIRNWPADCFVILYCAVFHYLQVTRPLFHLFYIERTMKNIDKTTEGLKKVLEDKILFREFCEFCKKDCCVENALFYKEYQKFKTAIKNNKNIKKKQSNEHDDLKEYSNNSSDNDVIKNSIAINMENTINNYNNAFNNGSMVINESDEISNYEYTNKNSIDISDCSDKKTTTTVKKSQSYSLKKTPVDTFQIAVDIVNKFILPNSVYTVNIDNKISRNIIDVIKQYENRNVNESINTFNTNASPNNDLTESLFETIFDDACDEVITNLYLNCYLKYVRTKNS